MLPYIQRSESVQESSLRNPEENEAVQKNLPGEKALGSKRERCHPPLRYLYEVHRREVNDHATPTTQIEDTTPQGHFG